MVTTRNINAVRGIGSRSAPLRMVAFGDSNGQYPLSWARSIARLSNGKIRLVNNACVAGETSAQIALRFGRDGYPYQADIYAFQIGTNDAAASASIVPQMRSLIKQARALASNPYVFVCATIPHYQYISAGATTLADLQAMVTADFGSDTRVIFIDTYTPLLDPTNPASIPNSFFADVHFARRGVWKFGETVLANASVAALLTSIVPAAQASANDATRQAIPNPNFDTGAESSGKANNWTSGSTGTAATFSTGTDAAITGKYQRITIPAGNSFAELKNTVSTLAAATYGGRRVWVSYKVRIVSRPGDVSPVVIFSNNPGFTPDPSVYRFGDAQYGLSASTVSSLLMSDLEDGVWYYIYNEFVADELPATSNQLVAAGSGNNSASTAIVIDVAEVNWGLLDHQASLPLGLSASYQDSSGSPGAATINRSSGRSAIAVAASSVVITNNRVSATSVVLAVLEDADSTATRLTVTCASGSFTVTANAAATATTKFRWAIIN